jgi:hypothetical protein
MSAPTQITVTYLTYSSANPAVITTATATIAITAGLQSLDSTTQGAIQTGYSAFDVLLAGIARNFGVRFTDVSNVLTFIPLNMITKITTP